MGLISSLNSVMAGLVSPRPTDVSSRPVGRPEAPVSSKPLQSAAEANSRAAAQAREAWVNRTFNASLQSYYTRQVSDAAATRAQMHSLNRLQALFGMEGVGALDRRFDGLQTALQGLAANADDPAASTQFVAEARNMVQALHRFSVNIQDMRQQASGQIATAADRLNGTLKALGTLNTRLGEGSALPVLIEQRHRLVVSVAELIDIKADYRADGGVMLTTRSGLGLLGEGRARFEVENSGLVLLTPPSGKTLELSQPGAILGGEMGGLLAMRDEALVEAQSQLDAIAAGLAQVFSTLQVAGVSIEVEGAQGVDLDISGMRPGDDIVLSYTDYGSQEHVQIVNTRQALDYIDAGGQRVLSVDLSGEVSEAVAALAERLPRFRISEAGEGSLRILGSGATGGIAITAAAVRTTGDAEASLFTDIGGQAFVNDLDADPLQQAGFAGRIMVNEAFSPTGGLADELVDQLGKRQFISGSLGGNLGDIISGTIAVQGGVAAQGLWRNDERQMMLNAVTQQMGKAETAGTEMNRLLDLENMFAANAQVVLVFKELMDTL